MSSRHIYIVLALMFLAAGAWWLMQSRDSASDALTEAERVEIAGGTLKRAAAGMQHYTNATYRFSLELPEGYAISMIPEGEGHLVLFRDGSGAKPDFQMLVTSFDEEGPLTEARVREDLPNMRMDNPLQVVIAGGGADALIFETDNEALGTSPASGGTSREAWFIAGGNLYQLTAPQGSDSVIGPVLESLRFE